MMELVKLKDICTMKSGGTPSRSNLSYWNNGHLPWAKISDLETSKDGFIYDTEEKITQQGLDAINNRWFKQGTLLLAMYGSVGKTAIAKIDLTTNQAILGIEINDEKRLDINYLRFWFQTIKSKLMDRAVGAALLNISLAIVKDLEIPLPDLATQKAIAAKLDKADEIRQLNKKLIEQYDALTQSLFLDMFGDPVKNEKGWEVKTLKDVCTKITDGEHTTPRRETSGVYLLSARNVKNGYIDLTVGVDYIGIEEYDRISKRCNPEKNDILLSCSGSVGRVSIVDVPYKFALVRSVALIKPKREIINSSYLSIYMQSQYFQNQIVQYSKKSSQANLFLGSINELKILQPPLTLQNEFAERVKAIEAQKALAQQALQQSEDLFNSLLQESFK